ncbi:hypothetical protein DSECCO2_545660 [anaerobic digester metagenome]
MYFSASSIVITDKSSWFGFLKLIDAFSTSVRIIRMSASMSSASLSAAKSLSITAATPFKEPSSFSITGIPPPPHATVIVVSHSVLIVPISTILSGIGEATTLLHPLPASSFTV